MYLRRNVPEVRRYIEQVNAVQIGKRSPEKGDFLQIFAVKRLKMHEKSRKSCQWVHIPSQTPPSEIAPSPDHLVLQDESISY